MNRRKEILNEYKERKRSGGVYKITNTMSEKYLLGHAADLKSVQNHFQFAVTTGSAMHPRLKKDWEEMGGAIFALEVLEEMEPRDGQSQAEFIEDLKTLEQLLRDNLDLTKEY